MQSEAQNAPGAQSDVALPEGAGDGDWLAGIDRLLGAVRDHGSQAIVVSLGVDAAVDDPNSPLLVTAAGFREAGRRIAHAGLPTVFVQEGGYVLDTLGPLVLEVLEGFETVQTSGERHG